MADADFEYTEMFPLGPDETEYRLVSADGVSTFETPEGTFLKVEPDAIRKLTAEAMHDIAHFLRTSHLEQLRKILNDPEASDNDRFVALDLLKNAAIAAGGVLPMCQDTGTAIVKGKKGEYVFTGGGDEEQIARGIADTYLTTNLRYSQMAPLDMYTEKNTGTNIPAEIKINAIDGDAYKFLFMAKGGGSANKSFLFQETKALLNEATLLPWIFDKIQAIGTSACPPYHLAIVIGGTSAEIAVETAKLASAGRSSAASTSAMTSASFASPGTARRARSAWRCRAQRTARRWARSPRKAFSSNSSRPTRRASSPQLDQRTCSTPSRSTSTSTGRWTTSVPRSLNCRSRRR